MGTSLRLLILEDNPSDAEMALHALRRAGYDPIANRVETEREYIDFLETAPELILSDFTMPEFDALRALEIMHNLKLDIPFIIVSGTIGEERAVEAMHLGATDYVMKDRLGRLGQAVIQALGQQKLKVEKRKSEQIIAHLAAIVETSSDAIYTKTLDGIITSWNPAADLLYGYRGQEVFGTNDSVLSPNGRRLTDTPENHGDMLARLRKGEPLAPIETVRVRKDGRRIEVLLSLSPIYDTSGDVNGASVIAHDITQRMRTERFLKAERAVSGILADAKNLEEAGPKLLPMIAECMRWEVAVLWRVDRTANVLRRMNSWHATWADASFVEALGGKTALEPGRGVAGRTWSTGEVVWETGIVFDNYGEKSTASSGEGLRGGFGLPMREGVEMVGVIEFYNPELQEPDKLLLGALDNIANQISQFSERRRSESELLASEIQFRQLADAMPQIVWTARPDGTVDYFNERWYQFSKRSRKDVLQHIWPSNVHADDVDRGQTLWNESVRSGAPFDIEIRLVERDSGRHRWFLFRAVAGADAAGKITRWYGTGTDIDDQKKSLEALQVSEQRFRNLLMALPAAVYTTDQSGLITLYNEHAVTLWGRRPELGKDRWCGAWKLLRPDGTPVPDEETPMAITVRAGHGVRGEEFIIERPDGSRAHVKKHPEALRGPDGEIVGAVNMVIDLTQTKLLEEQFRQSQKMEAIGQLAAGVAHDFNNLLTIIMGYSELLLVKLPATDDSRDHVGEIHKAGERAVGLTRQLLAFGRKQILAPEVLDLNSLMTEIEKMLRRLIGADIELVTLLEKNLGRVKVDPGQVEQIVVNLVVNARDAMPTGGRLTIKTQNVVLSEAQKRQHAELPLGAYTMFSVSDSGCGMNAATMSRIYEPFFTTKEVGKGTGLGLATVFGIIKQSGGFIEADSAIGSGTTFRTYLPQISDATQHKTSERGQIKLPKGEETILLVEDEDGLRNLAQLLLEASGYKVLSTQNGAEAVRVAYGYEGVIHLLFTDVVMPKMSGRQLSDLLIPSRPDMKVLFMSGYTDDTMVRHGIQDAETNFLAKPFTGIALTQKVRDVLDGGVGQPEPVGVGSSALAKP